MPYVAKMQVGTTKKKDTTTTPVGVLSGALLADIIAAPNPATNTLTIRGLKQGESITLSDISGRSVLQMSNTQSREFTIATGGFPKGVYFLQVRSGTTSLVRRIVLE
jgi:hypothetical protein